MSDDDWSTEEIRRLASESGKPLEVVTAQAFLASENHDGWTAQLGSYFQDGERTRELDVLAVRTQVLHQQNTTCRLRALVSCRGFSHASSPITFSLSGSSPLTLQPSFLAGHRRPYTHADVSPDSELATKLGTQMAPRALTHLELEAARPVVGFDVAERDVILDKQGNQRRIDYRMLGDRFINESIDSAVKAAIYWAAHDQNASEPEGFVTLNVPVCVFLRPPWDVCIDGGVVLQPERRVASYQTNAYPLFTPKFRYRHLTILVVAKTELVRLVTALDSLFVDFSRAFEDAATTWIRRRT